MANTSLAINYWGYFTPFGGYGISNLNWVKHLTRAGVDVTCHRKFIPPPESNEWKALTDEEKEILSKPFKRQKIGIIETTPFNFDMIDNEIKVASTMCEGDRIGGDWVRNTLRMDHVILPNEFNKRAFIFSGIPHEKCRVIRPGTETERFPFYERPMRDLYTFGMVGYMNDRKSVFEVITAFLSEFADWEGVRLYIKSSNKNFGYYKNWTDPRIIVDIRHLPMEEMNRIYQGFDCFVFPSKAEGIGMPPREAMSTGLPTIVMDYSGLEEIADPTYTYPIKPKELEFGLNPVGDNQPSKWATVDVQELMYWMRHVFENFEEAEEKGIRSAEWIREEHSWDNATTEMIKFLEEINV